MQHFRGGFAGAAGAHILVSSPAAARLYFLPCGTIGAGLCWLLAVQKRFDIFCPLKVLLELRTCAPASAINSLNEGHTRALPDRWDRQP